MRQSFDDVTNDRRRARDAAIAAMGQRLAAAGPRTRQKVTQRYHPVADADDDGDVAPAAPKPVRSNATLVADRSQAFVRDVAPILPPSPRRRALTAIGRAGALATMASAGFAVVLLAQSPRWSAAHRPAGHKDAAEKVAAKVAPATPDIAAPAAPQTQIAENATDATPAVAPAPIERPADPPVASAAPAPPAPIVKPVAMPLRAEPPAAVSRPSAAPIRLSRPVPVQLAPLYGPPLPVQRPVLVAVRHEVLRPAAPRAVLIAHYSLPRWLTEARDTPAKPLIMSPPPHDLEAPAQVAAHVATPAPVEQVAASALVESPRPALPPVPRPRIIYASAGYMAPAPYRGPYGGYYGPAYPPAPYGYYQQQPYAP